MLTLAEVVATAGDLRTRVNPKYRFDERMHDLTQCLLLDGYIIQEKKLLQTDPSIADAEPLVDELIEALQNSGAPRAQEIVAKINDSAGAFRATPPDYNASLVNARVALEPWLAMWLPISAHCSRYQLLTTHRSGARYLHSCVAVVKSRPKKKRGWLACSDF